MNIEKTLSRIESLVAITAKEVLNVHEAAALIGVTANRIYHLTAERAIPHYKKGNTLTFRKSELEQWLLGEKIPTAYDIEKEAQAYIINQQRNARSSKRASKS